MAKFKLESPYDPAIPLLGTHPDTESDISKGFLHTHVHRGIVHKSQKWEATQLSVDG